MNQLGTTQTATRTLPIESSFEDREFVVLVVAFMAFSYGLYTLRRATPRARLLLLALAFLVVGLVITNIESAYSGTAALLLNVGEHLCYLLHTVMVGWFLLTDREGQKS